MKTVKMIKGILIDSVNKEVREIEIDDDNFLQECYKALDCHIIEAVNLGTSGNTLWIDEEGRCKTVETSFTLRGLPMPIAGKGLILGYDARKDKNKSTNFNIEKVKAGIEFATGDLPEPEIQVIVFD